jgi:serine/threonine protein kinase
MHKKNIFHRDLKLANILLHFPDYPELLEKSEDEKKLFLKSVDLLKEKFSVYIADFGFSKEVPDDKRKHTFSGTPLYMSP